MGGACCTTAGVPAWTTSRSVLAAGASCGTCPVCVGVAC